VGLVKSYGGSNALDGVTLDVGEGELVALIGANGSGKSTLLKILFGILSSDAGDVSVLGLDPLREQPRLRAIAGYAGQDVALDGEITGWETLRLFYALRRLPHRERSERLGRLIDEYALGAFCDRRVAGFSGGERQRLHLALETMHEPRLLLLDEPTSSLDPGGRRALWGRLASLRDAGHTIIVSSHDLPDVASYCDRVALLEHGHLRAFDSPAALVGAHGRACTTITLARRMGEDAGRLRAELSSIAPEVVVDNFTITLWRDRHPDGVEPALAMLSERHIPYTRYERGEPDLAGAYFRLTGNTLAPVAAGGRGRGGGGRGRRRS
jgi:ABC-2 type transport system ATP-binding protein